MDFSYEIAVFINFQDSQSNLFNTFDFTTERLTELDFLKFIHLHEQFN